MSDFPQFNPADHSEGEVIPHDPPASDRSLARRVALQVLYEVDSTGHPPGEVLAIHFQARELSRKAASYTRRLVEGVTEHRKAIDEVITNFAPEWPIDQIAFVDRNILRIALLEFGVFARIPIGVAIDEAVSLARVFGAESSTSFINGVLGTIAETPNVIANLRIEEDQNEEDEQ